MRIVVGKIIKITPHYNNLRDDIISSLLIITVSQTVIAQ